MTAVAIANWEKIYMIPRSFWVTLRKLALKPRTITENTSVLAEGS